MHFFKVSVVFMCSFVVSNTAARMSPGEWSGGGLPDYSYSPENTIYTGEVFTLAFLNYTFEQQGAPVDVGGQDGKYGEGRIMDSVGIVVHIRNSDNKTNHTGCSSALFDGDFPNKNEPWIALIQRGGCNFEDKVKNAHGRGASGVLIYNDRDSKTLDKMKLIDKNRNISAVFTYKDKGEELAQLVDNGTQVTLSILVGNRQYRPTSNMNRTSVLFVSISFILLMVMSISWLVFYYIQRFRYIHAKDRLSKRLCSAAKKALSKIPIKNLKVEDKEIQGDGECCAVCIEPYKLSDVLRILPCRHDFHKSCIDPWLLEHRTCPMCKMDILKYYGFVFTGSQESILQLDMEDGERRTTSSGPGSPNAHAALETNSYDVDHSERSSRASSPDELTPSLPNIAHTSNHPSAPEKRILEQSPSKKSSINDKSIPSQSNFYIVSEKTLKFHNAHDISKTSLKNCNSEPTTPSKSCVCIKEATSKCNHSSLEDSDFSPEHQNSDTKRILPRVHSSPSCSRSMDNPPYNPKYNV